MKCSLLFAVLLLKLTTQAQYQVQKGHWFIGHTAGELAFTKYHAKALEEGEPSGEYSTRQFGFRFGFSGPDWGSLEIGKNKNKDENSDFESEESGFAIYLQPQAGYFISDNLVIGANVSIGIETYRYSNDSDIGKGKYLEFGIGPTLRYYLGKSVKKKPFIGFESRFDITKENDKTDYTAGQWMEYYDYDTNGSRVMIRPFAGYAWFLGKRWTADLRVHYTYAKHTTKRKTSFYVDRSMDSDYPQSDRVEETYNTIGLSIGIGYTF